VVQTLSALRDLPGVLNVALVYQHAEPWETMQQEMP
jgi:nitrate reductase NapD